MRKYFSNVAELDKAEEDDEVLPQGSVSSQRVFINRRQELDMVIQLLDAQITMDDFVESQVITSDNGMLLQQFVDRIRRTHNSLPSVYA